MAGGRGPYQKTSSSQRMLGVEEVVVMRGAFAVAGGVKLRVHPTGAFMARVSGFSSSISVIFKNGEVGNGDVVGVVTNYVGYKDRVAMRYDNTSRGRVLGGTRRLVASNFNRRWCYHNLVGK